MKMIFGNSVISALLNAVIFGAIVGWIASYLMKDDNPLIENILLGFAGYLVGSWLAVQLFRYKFYDLSVGNILLSILGACALILIRRAISRFR